MKIPLKALSNLIFSNSCVLCNKNNIVAGSLCYTCIKQLELFNYENKCKKCLNNCNNEKCTNCNDSYVIKQSFACLKYNMITSSLIKNFKHKDQTILQPFFTQLLCKTAKQELKNIKVDIVCPMPLHYYRALFRRYNQSSLLAKDVALFLHAKFLYNLVLKIRHTKSQSLLTRKERLTNLQNAFVFNKKLKENIKGKNVLIIDDVITTGTSANEVAKQIVKNGAKNVYVLCVAKSLNDYKT